MKRLLLVTALVLNSAPLAAQVDVGSPPTSSPFRDLEFRHELTAFGGYYFAAKDPAGVAPRSAPMGGLRYELVIGGPVELVYRVARVNSERRVIDPLEPAASRELGVQSWPLYLTDLGFALNLTGQRSWHGVVPVLNAGIGLVSDLDKKAENDQFNVGTTFAFSFGAGLRIVPGGRFQMRADVGTWMYEYKYPNTYYATTSDNTTVLPDNQAKNFWKKNLGLTLGASYLLFR
ncbi:MAG TPA: hypothetical protein VF042_04570 [Gemmatimonadaceae bacterium]